MKVPRPLRVIVRQHPLIAIDSPIAIRASGNLVRMVMTAPPGDCVMLAIEPRSSIMPVNKFLTQRKTQENLTFYR